MWIKASGERLSDWDLAHLGRIGEARMIFGQASATSGSQPTQQASLWPAKDLSRNKLIKQEIPRLDFIVPIPVEFIAPDLDLCKFLIGDLEACPVGFRV